MRQLTAIFKGSAYVAAAAVLACAALIGIDVFLRFTINAPITGAYEIACIFFMSMTFFALAWVQISRKHMRMTFISDRFTGRGGEVLRIFMDILILAFFAVFVLWQSSWEAAEAIRLKGLDPGFIRVPVIIPAGIMVIGSVFIIAACIHDIINGVKGLLSPEQKIVPELPPQEQASAM